CANPPICNRFKVGGSASPPFSLPAPVHPVGPAAAPPAPAAVTLPRVKFLVIGGSGLLGLRVTRQARLARHAVIATSCASAPPAIDVDWRQLDIRHRDHVMALVRGTRPDAVVNAAYRQSDWTTTADGATHLAVARAAAR